MTTSSAPPESAYRSLFGGTPIGRITEDYRLDCYVADPPISLPSGIVVLFPSATGWSFSNNRVLAYDYARHGNLQVFLRDLMDGELFSDSSKHLR
jgi:hypothetical protein